MKEIKNTKKDIDFFNSLLTKNKLSDYGYDRIVIEDKDYIKYFQKNSLGMHKDYIYTHTSIKNGIDVLFYIKSWGELQISQWLDGIWEQSLGGVYKIVDTLIEEILEDIEGQENKDRIKRLLLKGIKTRRANN